MFQAAHPEAEPGNRVVDLYSGHIHQHLAPKPSDNHYDNYIKQLDGVLQMAQGNVTCIHTVSDASAPSKGELQVSLAFLVFRVQAKIAHIIMTEGRATAPNMELMVLKISVATALVAGCSSLVCFMDSMSAMLDLVDPSPHSGQGSSLAACYALRQWFMGDVAQVLHLWHVPYKQE